jgi:hypothetical protein
VASENSMCPGSTQPLKIKNEYQDTPGGKGRPVRKADNRPPLSADVTESGRLKIPEISGSHRPVMEMLFIICCN